MQSKRQGPRRRKDNETLQMPTMSAQRRGCTSDGSFVHSLDDPANKQMNKYTGTVSWKILVLEAYKVVFELTTRGSAALAATAKAV